MKRIIIIVLTTVLLAMSCKEQPITMKAERYYRADEDLTANDAKYIRTENRR